MDRDLTGHAAGHTGPALMLWLEEGPLIPAFPSPSL